MNEFDFFSNVERSILAAAIEQDADSPCRVRAVTPESTEPTMDFGSGGIVVRLRDANPIVVSAATVFGRQPDSESVLGQSATCVEIDDAYISREHVAIVVIDGAAHALDLESSNGTTIRRGSANIALSSLVPTALERGDLLEFGLQTMLIEAV